MKIKTIRLRKYAELSPDQEIEVKSMIIFIALFAMGVIVGAGIIKKGSSTELITDFTSIFNIYIHNRNNSKIINMFFNSLTINLFLIILNFCAGLCCVGIPIAILTPITKGIGYGVLSGFLFIKYSMNGIGYFLLTIFPSGVIAASILLLASCSACLMSKELLAVILEKKQPNSIAVIKYIKRYLVYFSGILFSSAAETLLIKAFSYLFVF